MKSAFRQSVSLCIKQRSLDHRWAPVLTSKRATDDQLTTITGNVASEGDGAPLVQLESDIDGARSEFNPKARDVARPAVSP